jgi:hypothetical protein
MPNCPRCHQSVETQAIVCPYCRTALKAYGHPGIPLYRAVGDEFLCDSCTYHADDTCNYPQRPLAKECTLYQNHLLPQTPISYKPSLQTTWNTWLRRNASWIILVGLIVVSLLLALRTR